MRNMRYVFGKVPPKRAFAANLSPPGNLTEWEDTKILMRKSEFYLEAH